MPAGPNAYNSLWQVQTDAWSALEESTAQLALAGSQQRPVEQLTDAVAEALDVLAPIERFWAFPGMQAFYRVRRKVEETFHEAYMTHTSTSPNYQILASLDLGRRQAALEGFELVQKQIENAMRLRDAVELEAHLTPDEVEQRVEAGEQVVSTTYVTPYPPGFPVLVPGHVFSPQILAFMGSLEIAATNRPAPPPDAAGLAPSTSPDAP